MQMRRLYEHVKKQGGAAGQYGMKNVREFVAEAFTNPEFQRALKGMSAPPQSTLRSAWDSLIRVLKRILGLPANSTNALSAAMTLGVEVMRENVVLARSARSSKWQPGQPLWPAPAASLVYRSACVARWSGGPAATGERLYLAE